MHITLIRSGGFAGISVHREIDTTTLGAEQRRAMEHLATRAKAERAAPNAEPDAFEYEITIDKSRFIVDGSSPAWHALIEMITTR